MRRRYGEQKQTCLRRIKLASARCDHFLVIRLPGVWTTSPSLEEEEEEVQEEEEECVSRSRAEVFTLHSLLYIHSVASVLCSISAAS